jgi:putative long chain acyl-CoA synthase
MAEMIRYGGLETDEESSPYEIAARHRLYRLRRYFPDRAPKDVPPLVLVPPIMFTADVWDVSERTSAVSALHKLGVDVWVVDFGRPEQESGGLERTLTDHVVALSDAVDDVRRITGRDVVLSGYSQGGMFSYQATAYRRGDGVDSLITYGSSVDTRAPLPVPLSAESFAQIAQRLVDSGLLRRVSAPGWWNVTFFRLLDPIKSAQGQLQFLKRLHDREALLPGERQRRFLGGEGYTAYPGPAFAELLEQFVVHNRMLEGGFVIGDRTVTLADIERPILTFVGEADAIAHPDSVRAIRRASPRAEVYEVTHRTGHFGLVGGGAANRRTWPNVAAWVHWRAGEGELPEAIVSAGQVESTVVPTRSAVSQRAEQTAEFGLGVARLAHHAVSDTMGLVKAVAREGAAQVPRLNRLESLRPDTTISLGKLLDEAARRDPEGIALLFGDRAVRQRELKHRVDSVVKGLFSLGVRQGDRVGVLMSSRPSSLTVVGAISRLGATAVLLRPDGAIDLEARLGEISWLISDPDHAANSQPMTGVGWCVLGGGTEPRELPPHVVDMERIDPDEVSVPRWYRPNPRRAGDVAFVLFTGEGRATKPIVVTNHRWALSAFGTATAAALKSNDTVYSVTPLHHSSGLLMALGGAIAAGARFALASGTDSDTFWSEVRRYGATHVSYTWTSLRDVAYGPEHPNEHHHPIRLFIGSGMPRNLWKRICERCAPARVLEFYASAEGEAILANVSGTKVGSMGRSLPGTAEVRIAAWDANAGRLLTGADGMGRECRADEAGLLLARLDPTAPARRSLRSVLTPGDAWQPTGDLFIRDNDGDFWLVDPADSLIPTAGGPVAPSKVSNALGAIPSVDMAVAYGVPDGQQQVLVAAVTLLPGCELTAADLESVAGHVAAEERPLYVQVVTQIPVSTWSRPLLQPLRDAGIPDPDRVDAVWERAADGRSYNRCGEATPAAQPRAPGSPPASRRGRGERPAVPGGPPKP